jgi:hypothetical protein
MPSHLPSHDNVVNDITLSEKDEDACVLPSQENCIPPPPEFEDWCKEDD